MNRQNNPAAAFAGFLTLSISLAFLPGCGGNSSGGPPPTTPGASLSASSLTFTGTLVGTPSAGQSVTLNSTGTGSLTLSSIAATGDFAQTNNCLNTMAPGTTCTISVVFTPTAEGSRTGTLTVTDNAGNSPQTVSLSGTGTASTVSLSTTTLAFATQIMLGTPSTSQAVVLTNNGTQALTITGIVASGDFAEADNCGSSVPAGGNCNISVTFAPTAVGSRTGTLTVTDDSNGASGTTQTVALSGSGFTDNHVDVSVNFGPNGDQGPPTLSSSSYYNGIFATVTVCEPGTTTCATVPDVLVDTGSIGLRVLSNQLGTLSLPAITDGSGNSLFECVAYGDTSYSWGPVQLATIKIGGETASNTPGFSPDTGVPIQVITAGATAPSGAPCLTGGGPSNNSVSILGANGILGIANYIQDCGTACTSSSNFNSGYYPYLLCSSSSCNLATVSTDNQVWNPVPAFASADTNGIQLQLPPIGASGAATVDATSTPPARLIFGIGTQSCPGSPPGCYANDLGSATTYAIDNSGSFPSVQFNGVTYASSSVPGYLDSGSQGYFILDATTLGTTDCTISATDIFLYCPASTLNYSGITFGGSTNASPPSFSISIANALTLFSANPSFAAFNNLGGDSGSGLSSDSLDFGLPFFFGKNVYVGVESSTYANGYFAF